MATPKNEIIRKYVVRKTINTDTAKRNLQPEIGRIKAVINSLSKVETTAAEWRRLDTELLSLQRIVRGKFTDFDWT